jgi:hypothetical protein
MTADEPFTGRFVCYCQGCPFQPSSAARDLKDFQSEDWYTDSDPYRRTCQPSSIPNLRSSSTTFPDTFAFSALHYSDRIVPTYIVVPLCIPLSSPLHTPHFHTLCVYPLPTSAQHFANPHKSSQSLPPFMHCMIYRPPFSFDASFFHARKLAS